MAKGLHYIATLDNTDLKKKFADQRQMILDSGKTAEAQGQMVETSFKKIAQSLAMIGGGMSVGYLAKELYTFAGAFDKSMKEVSTISKTVDANINGFKSSVLEMTTQVPVGADAAVKALYQIVSAGHDGANGLQVLEIAAKAAIGGVTETVTAADAITTVLNAYKKDAGEAENISDQLFTTVRLGKTTFGELGQTISQVVPIAASFGIETEQVLAAVATLTKSGTPTAQAMTQIRASIVAASKVLGDGYFQTHTFQEGLNEIALRAGGSESKLRALIPEIEGMNGMLGLTGINAKTAAADLAELGISAGATQQAFAKMNDEAGAQLTILKNTILKKFHDIGKGTVDMVDSFAKLLNSDGLFNDKMIDDVIASLVVLIATVGTYKASLIATNAIQRVSTSVQYAAEMAELTKLLPAKQADANADIMSAVAKGRLSQATAERLIALRSEVAAELEALKVKAQLAHADMLAAMETDKVAKSSLISATALVASKQDELRWAQQTGNAKVIETAQQALNNAEVEKRSALAITRVTSSQLEVAQNKAASTSLAVDTMQTNINTAATNGGTVAKNLFSAATLRLKNAFNSLKVAFATNPIGMIITGATMAISLFSMFGKKTKEVAEEFKNMKQSVDEIASQFKEFDAKANGVKKLTDEYKELSGKVSNTKDESERLKIIIDLLAHAYPDAVTKVNEYGDALDVNIGRVNRAIEAERKLLLIKNRDAISKVAKEAGGAFNDYVDYSKDEKRSRNNEASIQKSIESTTLFPGRQNNLKKFLAKTKENTLEFKADADQNLDIFYAYIKEMERLSMTSSEIAARINEEAGTTLSEGNINWVKQTLEGAKKATNEIVEDAKKKTPQTTEQTTEQIASAKKATEDYTKTQKEISDAQLKNRQEAEKAKIDALANGRVKELAQIELTRKAKVAAIDQEERELREKNKGKEVSQEDQQSFTTRRNTATTVASSDTAQVEAKYAKEIETLYAQIANVFLSEEERKQNAVMATYDSMRTQIEALYNGGGISGSQWLSAMWDIDEGEQKATLDALLSGIETYEQQRQAVQEEYAQRRKTLYEEDGKTLKNDVVQGNVDELDRNEKNAVAAVDETFAEREASYQVWMEEITNFSLQQLEVALTEAKQKLAEAEGSGADDKTLSTARAKVNVATEKVTKANAKNKTSPGKKSIKEWQDLYKTLGEVAGEFGKIGDAVGGAAGEAMKTAGTIAATTIKMISDITSLVDDSANAMKATTDVAAKTMSTMEKASVILAIIGAALQIAMAIASLFNEDKEHQKQIESLQTRIDQLQWELDNVEVGRLHKNNVDILKNMRDVYAETTSEVMKLHATEIARGGVLGKILFPAIYQNDILLKSTEKLAQFYANVGYAADKALGEEKYTGAQAALKNLSQQQLLIQQQINHEQAKKKTDDGQIAQWEQQIYEIGQKAIEMINELVEDIIGGSSSDIANDLGSAFFDAFQEGEDAAVAWGDKVNDIVADIMKRMLISKYLEGPLGDVFDKYKKKWFGNGDFQLSNVINSMDDFANDLMAEGDNFKAIWDNLPDNIKDMFSPADPERETSERGIATASQESVDENNGRLTAIQMHTSAISGNVTLMQLDIVSVRDSMSTLRDTAVAQLTVMKGIEGNTQSLHRLEKIETDMGSMKETLNDIAIKGIKIR